MYSHLFITFLSTGFLYFFYRSLVEIYGSKKWSDSFWEMIILLLIIIVGYYYYKGFLKENEIDLRFWKK